MVPWTILLIMLYVLAACFVLSVALAIFRVVKFQRFLEMMVCVLLLAIACFLFLITATLMGGAYR